MGDILDEVVRRFLSIVMVLVMAGAPVAVDLCQLACAHTAASQTSQAGQDHSACHHPDGAQGRHVAPMSHPCDHGDGLPVPSTLSALNMHRSLPLAVAAAGISLNPLRLPRADLASAASIPPRPLEIQLVVPLRI